MRATHVGELTDTMGITKLCQITERIYYSMPLSSKRARAAAGWRMRAAMRLAGRSGRVSQSRVKRLNKVSSLLNQKNEKKTSRFFSSARRTIIWKVKWSGIQQRADWSQGWNKREIRYVCLKKKESSTSHDG